MTSTSNDNHEDRIAQTCPVCKKTAVAAYAPFCSRRCADVDLHRWLSGGYAIPSAEDDSDGAPLDPGET